MINTSMNFGNPLISIGMETGKRIKNYIYNYSDLIGKGNFAKVYKGINEKTMEVVAIKIVSLDSLKSKKLEELIFQEIKILQQMNHPNILKFHEALLSERNCYIITQLCKDGDLEELINKKKLLTEVQIYGLITDIYNGLKYLREMKVTHRDLKTANVFLHHGKAKIADFGLAKMYKENFKDLDIGSPLYMSPEGMLLNIYGQKTDIWAFGIIIYELLHGQTPFCNSINEVQLKKAVVKPLPQYKFRKNIPEGLKRLINILMEINQNKRPSVYELANQPFMQFLLNNCQFKGSKGNSNQPNRMEQNVPQHQRIPVKGQQQTLLVMQDSASNSFNQAYQLHGGVFFPENKTFSKIADNNNKNMKPNIPIFQNNQTNICSNHLQIPRIVLKKTIETKTTPNQHPNSNTGREEKKFSKEMSLKTFQLTPINQIKIQRNDIAFKGIQHSLKFEDNQKQMMMRPLINPKMTTNMQKVYDQKSRFKTSEFSQKTVESTKEAEQERKQLALNRYYFLQ